MLDKGRVFHSLHCCSVCSLQLLFTAGTRWSALWLAVLCYGKIAAILLFPPFLYLCILYFRQQTRSCRRGHMQKWFHVLSYTVLLHFLKEARDSPRALQLVGVLKSEIQTLESEIVVTVQLCKSLCAFPASVLQTTVLSVFGLTLSEVGDHFVQIRSSCSTLPTVQNTSQPPKLTSLLNTAATKPVLAFHRCLGMTSIEKKKKISNLRPPLLFKAWS